MSGLLLIAVFGLDESFVAKIRDAAGEAFDVFHAKSADDVASHIRETEVMFGYRMDPELLEKAERLSWIQATGAGVEYALTPSFVASPVTFTNASGIHAIQMSEYAVGMMIALGRNFPFYVRAQRKKTWDRSLGLLEGGELSGATLGILGLGSIGEALAFRAKAFGMRVLGVKRSPRGYSGAADEVVAPGAATRIVSESDYIVNLLPLTPETKGFVSAEMIAAMKPGSYFLNLGRGKTVDEMALTKALADGRIAGAALDVTYDEPLAEESLLWEMPNVILTPHVSGHSPHYWQRATDLFCENLGRYMAGRELLNVVDKDLGY